MTTIEPINDDQAVWEAWGSYDSALKQWFRNGSGDPDSKRAAVYLAIRDQAIRALRFHAHCRVCGYYESSHTSEMTRGAFGIDHDFVVPWDEARALTATRSTHDDDL